MHSPCVVGDIIAVGGDNEPRVKKARQAAPAILTAPVEESAEVWVCPHQSQTVFCVGVWSSNVPIRDTLSRFGPRSDSWTSASALHRKESWILPQVTKNESLRQELEHVKLHW